MAQETGQPSLESSLQLYIPDYRIIRPSDVPQGQVSIANYQTADDRLSLLNIILGGEAGTVHMDVDLVNGTIQNYLSSLRNYNQAHHAIAAIDFTAVAQLPTDLLNINFLGLTRIQINRGLSAQFLAMHQPILAGSNGIVIQAVRLAKKAMSVSEYSGEDAGTKMLVGVQTYLESKMKTKELPPLDDPGA